MLCYTNQSEPVLALLRTFISNNISSPVPLSFLAYLARSLHSLVTLVRSSGQGKKGQGLSHSHRSRLLKPSKLTERDHRPMPMTETEGLLIDREGAPFTRSL